MLPFHVPFEGKENEKSSSWIGELGFIGFCFWG
jgi:hypothetical protein